jgi:hypothetical protein
MCFQLLNYKFEIILVGNSTLHGSASDDSRSFASYRRILVGEGGRRGGEKKFKKKRGGAMNLLTTLTVILEGCGRWKDEKHHTGKQGLQLSLFFLHIFQDLPLYPFHVNTGREKKNGERKEVEDREGRGRVRKGLIGEEWEASFPFPAVSPLHPYPFPTPLCSTLLTTRFRFLLSFSTC